MINIYEADYNLILKYFWPHKTTQFAERNNLLGENQWGGKTSMQRRQCGNDRRNEYRMSSHDMLHTVHISK